jgi:hypothetical protein
MYRSCRGPNRPVALGRTATAGRLVGFAIIFLAPNAAFATHKVYSPYVTQGEFEFEPRGHYTLDDNDAAADKQKYKVDIGYAFTDWWLAAYVGEFEKTPGDRFRYTSTAVENVFQLTERGEYWIDLGLYLEPEISNQPNQPNQIETKALLAKDMGRTSHWLNLVLKKQFGENATDDVIFEYAWQTRWHLFEFFEPGFEAFGETGRVNDPLSLSRQDHVFGPVAFGEFDPGFGPGKLVYEMGYLFGLTPSAANGTVKWLLEYEARF